jgi:hypothetical protein
LPASEALAGTARDRHIIPMSQQKTDPIPTPSPASAQKPAPAAGEREIGGPKGPEPTRYGDWEINGRCSDF